MLAALAGLRDRRGERSQHIQRGIGKENRHKDVKKRIDTMLAALAWGGLLTASEASTYNAAFEKENRRKENRRKENRCKDVKKRIDKE